MPQSTRATTGLVHVSEAANLALHALMLLASHRDEPLRIKQICAVINASESHLAKVMQRLSRAGLVSSVRGPRGGFTLAKAPERVTLLQIYEAIEGALPVHACLLGKKRCRGECMLGDIVRETNAKLTARLKGTRLADVAGAFAGRVRP